jgi:hypothetical protein
MYLDYFDIIHLNISFVQSVAFYQNICVHPFHIVPVGYLWLILLVRQAAGTNLGWTYIPG